LSNIREFMEADGLEFVYHRFIIHATGSVLFAKALDRSVTGSMNDLTKHATFLLAEGEVSPFEVGFRLNEIPMSALAGGKYAEFGVPRDKFKSMAS
jgi:hypothetical protein